METLEDIEHGWGKRSMYYFTMMYFLSLESLPHLDFNNSDTSTHIWMDRHTDRTDYRDALASKNSTLNDYFTSFWCIFKQSAD